MLTNSCIKQIVEFDQNYAPLEHMVIATNLQILAKTELEDKFYAKDLQLGIFFQTFEYVIFCNN